MIMSWQSQSTYEVTYPREVVSIGKNGGSDDHILSITEHILNGQNYL